MLWSEGFDVTSWEPGCDHDPKTFDLILYLSGDETLLCRGRIFWDWTEVTGHFGQAMRRYWYDVPTVMVSFGYPYMLYDAPRIPTYVNAYSTTETAQSAVVELLLGRSEWRGRNPVDPSCGLPDAEYRRRAMFRRVDVRGCRPSQAAPCRSQCKLAWLIKMRDPTILELSANLRQRPTNGLQRNAAAHGA